MDSEDELLVALTAFIIKSKHEQVRITEGYINWAQEIYKERDWYGVTNLVSQLIILNREQYFKLVLLFSFTFCWAETTTRG